MEVLITPNMKVFLGNKYNSYIHTTRNAKVTTARIVYEKTVMNGRFSEAHLEPTRTSTTKIL